MATTAAVLDILVKANTTQAQVALGKTQGALKGAEKSAGKTSGAISRLGKAFAGAFAVREAAKGVSFAISAASDLGEQINKTNVVFRKNGEDVVKWSKGLTRNFGLSQRAALEAAGTFGNMLVPMGFARGKAANMSKSLVQLAGDLASFNNASPEQTLEALRSGLAGETEPLRKFGIFLNDSRLKQEALNLHLKNAVGPNGALTTVAKAQATYSLILKDSKDAQGDFARTSGSLANQQRIMKAQLENVAATLGKVLVPIAAKAIQVFTGFISGLQKGTGAAGAFRDAVSVAFEKVKTVVAAAIAFMAGLLKEHAEDYAAVGKAARNVGKAIVFVWENVVLPVVKRVLPAIVAIVKGAFTVISGIVKLLSALLTGDFRKAWQAVKQIFRGALEVIGGIIRGATAPFREAAARIGGAIGSAFSDAWDRVKGKVRDLRGWLADRWVDIRDGFKKAAGGIRDAITLPFRAAVSAIGKFVGFILKVVDQIPGVDLKGPREMVSKFVEAHGLAKGGAFAQTGGKVNKPMVFMGEEAPSHPEFVIPTNPAYRKRARGLLAQAAGALGFAQGGVMSQEQIAALAGRHHMSNPELMAAIAMAESGGRPWIVGPPSGRGLWQIEWNNWQNTMTKAGLPDAFNPDQNAEMAKIVLAQQGLGAWVAYNSGAYRKFLSGSWDKDHTVFDPRKMIGDLVGKLPGTGDLPEWLRGMGGWALGKAKSFITDKVTGFFTSRGSGPGVMTTTGLHANLNEAIRLAMSRGFGYPASNQLTGGTHAPGSYHYQGRAVDFGYAGHSLGQMMGLRSALVNRFGLENIKELFFDPAPSYIKNGAWVKGAFGGHGDHLHFAMAKGGLFGGLPFAGSFGGGGVVPGPVGSRQMAVVHGGEPIGAGAVQVNLNIAPGMEWLRQFIDVRVEQGTRRQARAADRNLPGRGGGMLR